MFSGKVCLGVGLPPRQMRHKPLPGAGRHVGKRTGFFQQVGGRGDDRKAAEAAIEALRRNLPNLRALRGDFYNARKHVQPSGLREIMIQVPNVSWEDVGGLEEVSECCVKVSNSRSNTQRPSGA